MKLRLRKPGRSFLAANLGFVALLSSCMQQMSETVPDAEAGLNGSFEIVKGGLPVNWQFYTPKTTETGDFDIGIDSSNARDKKRSLKFAVRACSPQGGRFSPGIAQEIQAKPGENYHVSAWVKNTGAEFTLKLRGINATHGQDGPAFSTKDSIGVWQLKEFDYTIPENMDRLRIEVNVLSPGIFWIDDVKVEKKS